MTTYWAIFICLTLGLSSALVAGVFQAFSEFVMKALIATEPVGGIEAMQLINAKVYKTTFLGMLLGLMPLTLGFTIHSYFNIDGAAKFWIICGTLIYFIFVFMVTMFGNVPMNNKLAKMDPATPQAKEYWRHYGLVWTRWNHVRTIGSLLTAIFFLIASTI